MEVSRGMAVYQRTITQLTFGGVLVTFDEFIRPSEQFKNDCFDHWNRL